MSDKLVKQWGEYVESMGSVMSDVEHIAQQMCDRIESLQAERDKWKTAFDESCNAWQHTCEHEMDHAKKAEAERDRLRAIGTEMAESIEGNYYLPGVATRWRAALRGESHE